MEEKEAKKEKTFYKKWWFWLIILAIVIAIGFTTIMVVAFEYATGGIHQVAFDVQSIDDEATVYSSAGGNTKIVEIPNYTDDKKIKKKQEIETVLKNYASEGDVLSDYSKAIICTKMNSDTTSAEDYFLSFSVYELPSMNLQTDLGSIYIDFIEYTKQTLSTTTSNLTTSDQKGEDISLTAGKYVVGTDIKPGKYDAIAEANSGNFFVDGSTDVNEILSAKNDGFGIPKYSNLILKEGDTVEIRSSLSVKLQAK